MVPSSPPTPKPATARVAPHCFSSTYLSHRETPAFTHPARITSRARKPSLADADDEIDVFPAERYFSGHMDAPDALLSHRILSLQKDPDAVESRDPKESGTPSICSDASTNSRRSLLRQPPPRASRKHRRPNRLLDFLRCSSCTRSVQVEDKAVTSARSGTTTGAFGSPIHEVVHGGERISDASSDLFEIESISASTNACFAQSFTNGTSSASFCYEPSEASVEWSVATASAADGREEGPERKGQTAVVAGRRSHRGGLLGCSHYDAVRVLPPGPGKVAAAAADHRDRPEAHAVETVRVGIEERLAADLRHARPGRPWAAAAQNQI